MEKIIYHLKVATIFFNKLTFLNGEQINLLILISVKFFLLKKRMFPTNRS
jgi:hypothetical protein